MIHFPIYGIRENYKIETKNNITYVSTYYNTYVLDDKNLPSDSFLERRVLMLGNKYTHKIYPIDLKCINLIQVNTTYRWKGIKRFIDARGEILSYKPTTKVKVHWKKCKCVYNEELNYYMAICDNEPYPYIVKQPYQYLAIVYFKGAKHIYDVSMEKPERDIIWRKI